MRTLIPVPAFSTPILLIVWRRAACTARLLDALRSLRPQRLYLACDGAREGVVGETAQVASVRQLLDHGIDWPAQVQKRYSPVNQGCRQGPIAAMDWFFSQEEEGIILEDDCMPHPDFFPFCSALLEHYRHDRRVFTIVGSNYQQGIRRGQGSYYFSLHTNSWGWATWRRAWQCYPCASEQWPSFRYSSAYSALFPDRIEASFWGDILDNLLGIDGTEPFVHAWDYQWMLTCWLQRGLSAVANANLISNLGFEDGSTHCSGEAWYAHLPLEPLPLPLTHPTLVLPDPDADRQFFLRRFNGLALHLEARRQRWGALYPLLEKLAAVKRRLLRR